MIKKLFFLLLIPIGSFAKSSFNPDNKTNILFILVDDWGWTDLSSSGSKYYETPNIDRLAKEGMRFTQAYSVGPNCAPSRASLII